jgi:hypothetical protein
MMPATKPTTMIQIMPLMAVLSDASMMKQSGADRAPR